MSRIGISTRRSFLAQGLGLVGVSATVPNFLVRTALAAPKAAQNEQVLVVVELSGGHDGLSAMVPYADDNYAKNRQETRIGADEVIKINDQIGLHPNLTGFKELLDQDSFASVLGVGYPNPNRSHFTSMDIWHLGDNEARTNSTEKETNYGWIGKYCDYAHRGNQDPKLAMAVGTGRAPLAIHGKEHPGISFSTPSSYRYYGDRGSKDRLALYDNLNMEGAKKGGSSLDFVTQTTFNANASSESIRDLAGKHRTKTAYPSSSLASSLRTVAALIAGGLSTRIYYVFQGGFDTHSTQRSRHDRLMTDLNAAISAFQQDLKEQGNDGRVLTISFSEFGRRVKENFSQGTDHGVAGPMFLFGPCLKASLYGKQPSMADEDLDAGDLQHTVDFRSVYATALEKWLGTSSEAVLGAKFPMLDYLA